jgi:hypothetical protein
MLSALAGLVNVIAPIMTTQGGLLSLNAVQSVGFGSASFDIFYTLAGPWVAGAGAIETELASLMGSLVSVLQALAT